MPSLPLSNYIARIDPKSLPMRCVTWLLRILTGGVFIMSGFAKSIDPWGTLFKIEDYLSVMGLEIWPNLVTVFTFALCCMELVVGVMLVMGCFRRSITWLTLAIMCVMLPLTLWIAISDPVADCGCFGDAVIISNWASFWKNVFLTASTLWLVAYNRYCGWLITPALQWIALVSTSGFILIIALIGYLYQPLIDFRPFPIGSSIVKEDQPEGASFKFIYEKDGERREFGENETLPDESDGWTFVDRVEISSADQQSKEEEGEFRLWDAEGSEDLTEDALITDGDQILLLMPDLSQVSIASTWRINSLKSWADRQGINMIATVSATPEQIETWKDLSLPEYDIYSADDTQIKMVARGNPAVVYVSDGVIRWKSALRAIEADDFQDPEVSSDPMSFARDNRHILLNILYIYLAVMGVLAGLSFLPRLRHVFRITGGGKVRREESSSPDRPAQ